jgi:transcriptional regulator with XRE-family HTH domain
LIPKDDLYSMAIVPKFANISKGFAKMRREAWETVKSRISEVVKRVEGTDPKANARFADRIGKDRKLIAEWRNPKRPHKPNKEDLEKINQVYNISMDYLLYGAIETQDAEPASVYNQDSATKPITVEAAIQHYTAILDKFTKIMEKQEEIIYNLSKSLAKQAEESPGTGATEKDKSDNPCLRRR